MHIPNELSQSKAKSNEHLNIKRKGKCEESTKYATGYLKCKSCLKKNDGWDILKRGGGRGRARNGKDKMLENLN